MVLFFFLIAIIVGIPVVYCVVPLGVIVVVRFVRINVSFRVFTCCYSSWRSSCCRFCHCYLFLLVLLLWLLLFLLLYVLFLWLCCCRCRCRRSWWWRRWWCGSGAVVVVKSWFRSKEMVVVFLYRIGYTVETEATPLRQTVWHPAQLNNILCRLVLNTAAEIPLLAIRPPE